jgi:xylulokinase
LNLIAYDLGTGGVKASLYDAELHSLSSSFLEYKTYYPASNMHEQRPADWWEGIRKITKMLLDTSGVEEKEVAGIALSGQSLVAIPIDKDLCLLMDKVPIWSDTRATEEVREFFRSVDETEWYMTTGNGFPAPCYSIFKLMWYKKHRADLYARTYKVLGSKDYINLMLTRAIYTDRSYASGSGVYDLAKGRMREDYLSAADISQGIFPRIVPSHQIVGRVTAEAARETGLHEGIPVACGGVDNACMALGAVGPAEGKIYTSLGSSSWVPLNSSKPVLDLKKRPYVFAHIQEDMYTSAFSIFAGGSSLRWIRDTLCRDFVDDADAYKTIDELAEKVPVGSNGVIFNPSLAGGTSQDKSINIRGAFVGLTLGTTREDMMRAAMEGIAMNLKLAIDSLTEHTPNVSREILFCGGGSKSRFWMQMFADVFGMDIIKTNIDQDTASLGAAAIIARGLGIWNDYSSISSLHHIQYRSEPRPENTRRYCQLLKMFERASNVLADLGDYMMANGPE